MDFMRQRLGSFTVYISPQVSSVPEIMQILLPDPDAVFQRGDPIPSPWSGRDTDKRRVRIIDQDYFIKRYNCTGWLYRLKNMVRPSRALRSWHAAIRFRDYGVPTPEPLFCLEERHCRLLDRAYIIFPFLQNGIDLLRLWLQLDPAEQEACLVRLAAVFGHMHKQGVYHGDTNWRNILVRRAEDQWLFDLIDLDGCRFIKKPSKRMALRDLNHFDRDMDRHQVTTPAQKLFHAKWEQAFNGGSHAEA